MKYKTIHYVCDCCGQEYDESKILSSDDKLIYIPGREDRRINNINTHTSFLRGSTLCKDCYYAIADVIVGKIREIRYGSDPEMAKEIYENKEENNI